MKNKVTYLFDCDQFVPVEKMNISIPRRAVFSFAKEQIHAKKMSQNGFPAYQIENLTDWDVMEFQQIQPVVGRGVKIQIIEGIVCGIPCRGNEPIRLFPVLSFARNVFNRFDGQQRIGEIIPIIQKETGWSAEKSTAVVRNLFLRLCEIRICEPG